MATEARVRQLILGIAAEIDAADTTAIAAECAETGNNHRAAANLIRVYVNMMATKLESYKMTDGKQAKRRDLEDLLALADKYDEGATSKSTEVADLSMAVERTGEDLTEYRDE